MLYLLLSKKSYHKTKFVCYNILNTNNFGGADMDFNNNGLDDLLEFEMFNDDSDDYSFKRRNISQEDNTSVLHKILGIVLLIIILCLIF